MITARKNSLITRLFQSMNRRMLRRAFDAVYLAGEDHVARLNREHPVIFFGNHSCWWDGLMEFHLSAERFGFDAFLMMDEEQMRRYSFFRWIGAFSVNRQSAREAMESIQYAIRLFDRPNRVLWIYPQGILQPNDRRPLKFESGLLRLCRALPEAQLIPIAHRYEFLDQQRPAAFSLIGPPVKPVITGTGKELLGYLEEVLTTHLDSLGRSIALGETGRFRPILRGRSSTNIRYDSYRRTLNRT